MNLYIIFDGVDCRWDSTTIAIITAESFSQAQQLAEKKSLFGQVHELKPGTEAQVDYSFEQSGEDSNPGYEDTWTAEDF